MAGLPYQGGFSPPLYSVGVPVLATTISSRCVSLWPIRWINVRTMLADYRRMGETLWDRFNAGKQDQLWFLSSLTEVFRSAGSAGFLFEEFEKAVSELQELAGIA